MSETVKLRGNEPRWSPPYPLGEIPRDVIVGIGRKIVYELAIGKTDIAGDEFGRIFASAIGGLHRGKPLGIADVERDGCAWSVKTVKNSKPFESSGKTIRLISGRNSVSYSTGLKNSFDDVQATGDAILRIWNARFQEARAAFKELRVIVMLRNLATRQFLLTESAAHEFQPRDFVWEFNENSNLIGRRRNGDTDKVEFTWQPHGAQFTIHHPIPVSSQKFRISHLPPIQSEHTLLDTIGFDDSWIETV